MTENKKCNVVGNRCIYFKECKAIDKERIKYQSGSGLMFYILKYCPFCGGKLNDFITFPEVE